MTNNDEVISINNKHYSSQDVLLEVEFAGEKQKFTMLQVRQIAYYQILSSKGENLHKSII